MKSIVAGRVIANDKNGRAILVEPEKWKASLDLKKGLLKLEYSGTRCEYDLAHDTMCLAIRDSKQEAAVGKTFRRMAMTGIASSLLSGGKGMGGALMDLSLRGTETNIVLTMFLVMNDSTTVYLEGYGSVFETLRKLVPTDAIGENAQRAAGNMLSLAARMERDGARVLGELDQKAQTLTEEFNKFTSEAETGASFEVRDDARTRADEITKEIEVIKNLGKLVKHRLDSKSDESNSSPTGNGGAKFLKYGLGGLAGLLVLLFLIGLMSGNSNKNNSNGNASIPAPSPEATSTQTQAPVATTPVPQQGATEPASPAKAVRGVLRTLQKSWLIGTQMVIISTVIGTERDLS